MKEQLSAIGTPVLQEVLAISKGRLVKFPEEKSLTDFIATLEAELQKRQTGDGATGGSPLPEQNQERKKRVRALVSEVEALGQ